ncbi:hypothetical protein MBLNU13_g01325t1 [Cladosporium sp. NU13]
MIHGALRDGRRRAANAPSTRFSFLCSRPTRWPSRAFATSPAQGAVASTSGNINATRDKSVPKKHRSKQPPKRSAKDTPEQAVILQRLESCLPPHLRRAGESTLDETSFVPDAPATAKLALEFPSAGYKGILVYLAIDQGRWRAAVWLVKLLLEHFHMQPTHLDRLSYTVQEWNRTGTLDEITENPLYLVHNSDEIQAPHIKTSSSASLKKLTGNTGYNLRRSETFRQQLLGQIWLDIGRLVIEGSSYDDLAGGEVKPDVLEMIALFHHYELMPASIYSYIPAENEDAIQQPPTLHLLSNRIFTALSDATWRARELTAAEEAKKKGGLFMGLEAKGSSYRVRVSGIKPEIWLELILWSCLHGGWISEGAALLRSVYRAQRYGKWKPISWRDSLDAIMPFGRRDLLDWDSIKYNFDTRSSATMDGVDITRPRVDKTVSSEVVNAYIDALLTMVSAGVGNRGLDLGEVLQHIRDLRSFLKRANLNLGGGSWDAMMLRLVESGGIDIERNPAIVQQLGALSPPIGEELQSRRSQRIPTYVLDGSAAVLGLFHRALYAEIKNGSLEGALKVFQLLQGRVDKDRHQSLSDFFEHKHLSHAASDDSAQGLFTSNFSGIDYPSFSTQIPPTTLAAFLELVIANKAFDLGNWMVGIGNTDIDGQLIPPSLYADPHISAAVVHYATATDNTSLLSKITKHRAAQAKDGTLALPKELLQAFFNVQVELRHWDAAEKLLEYMHDSSDATWSVRNAATVGKIMIVEGRNVPNPDKMGPLLDRAAQIFALFLPRRTGAIRAFSRKRDEMNTLCVVLSAASPLLATFVSRSAALPKFFKFALPASVFNSVLEGVVATHGSEAGRALVNRFAIARRSTPQVLREKEQQEEEEEEEEEEPFNDDDGDDAPPSRSISAAPLPRMPRSMADAIKAGTLSRTNLTIACAGTPQATEKTVAMYGGFDNIGPTTVRIVVRQALLEHNNSDHSMPQQTNPPLFDICAWALVTLRCAGRDRFAALAELKSMETGLSANEMRGVEERAGEMWRQVVRRDEGRESDAFDI